MDKPTNLPARPGIYQFLSSQGEMLYVGKAVNLKSRVGSYFSSRHLDRPWIKTMIHLIDRVEVIVVGNEIEALMLEATLIQLHQPRFNLKLTDDKSYPYLKLTISEPIPRLVIVRRIAKDKDRYFGPYLSARVAGAIAQTLFDVYGLHSSPTILKATSRPCFACQLANRPCVLAGQIKEREYQESVVKAIEFLLGRQKRLLMDLNRSMLAAANQNNFELARRLRDRGALLKQSLSKTLVRSTRLGTYDVLGLAYSPELSSITILR
ncbi:MAG: GIY-YIG nuclease family protein, partial [Patescibacteria group bacterium]